MKPQYRLRVAPKGPVLGAWLSLLFSMAVFGTTAAAKEGKAYEEGIRELSDAIVTEVAKEKRTSVAVADFTDLKGHVTPLGRFIAEELSSTLVLSGEVQVVDRSRLEQILKKHRIAHADMGDPDNAKKLGLAANVHGLVVGTVSDMGPSVRVNAKVITTDNGRVLTAARTSLTKTGPVAEFLKPSTKPPAPRVAAKSESAAPHRPTYASELYRVTVTAATRQDKLLTLDLMVENTSARDLLVSCKLIDTFMQDEAGIEWRADADHNREGICIRGLKMPAATRQRATLTFGAPDKASGTTFTLHFHELEPRRDALYTIPGITTPTDPPKAH